MTVLSDKIQVNIINKDKHLDLSWCNLSGYEAQLAYLQELKHVTSLDLSENKIKNIEFLIHLPELAELNLWDNQISDILPLSHLTQLKKLSLTNNQIANISCLSNLKQLTELNLWNNQITDISALSNLDQLTWLGIDPKNLSFPPYWYACLRQDKKMPPSSAHYKQLTAIEKIWQIMASGDEENIELAKQIALGQGWSTEDFEMYEELIQNDF